MNIGLFIAVTIYSICIGILPNALWEYNILNIEWWVISIPLNLVGNAILVTTYSSKD